MLSASARWEPKGKELERRWWPLPTCRRSQAHRAQLHGDIHLAGTGQYRCTVFSACRWIPGDVGFVGQSGWVSEVMLRLGSDRGLRFSGIISIGNQSDLTLEDLIGYWGSDPNTNVIAAYVEGLKDAARFVRSGTGRFARISRSSSGKAGVRRWGPGRPLHIRARWPASYQVFQAMCRQTGIIPAYGMEDIIDLAVAFSCPVLPPGNNDLGLLIEAGGGARCFV